MPPKKIPAPTKKTELKKKEKVIEDKTFGLKNKKGAKQQKFIQQVEKQVKSGGQHPNKVEDVNKKVEKEKKLLEQRELATLFRAVTTQKVEKGADPKSIICVFFKQGQCTKGDKCKFSHDLSVERKAEKRSLYVDMRDDDEDTMENWDETKLLEVIEKKHGKSKMPTTDIICKYFLDAVEKSKYGWFWQCPSGEDCIYRHALPPGFTLKKDKKKTDKKDEISLEDLIERERAALGISQTKVTLDTFLAWKKRKILEKQENARKDEEKKRSELKAGRHIGLSGREMFNFNPELAMQNDDLDEDDETFEYYREEDEDGMTFKEIDFDLFQGEEVDGTGTQAGDRFPTTSPSDIEAAAASVPINENLFLDDDDLDALDEELSRVGLNS